MSQISARITEALSINGFVSTARLASWLGVGRDKVVEAFDQIEAAGIKLHRIHGLGGGAEIDELSVADLPARRVPGQRAIFAKRMRKAA